MPDRCPRPEPPSPPAQPAAEPAGGRWWEVTASLAPDGLVAAGAASPDLPVGPDPAAAGPEHDALAEALRERAQAGLAITHRGITAYFSRADEADAAACALGARWPAATVLVRPVQEEAWSGWQRAFVPVAAGERVRVYPSWLAPAGGGPEVAVVIEPGLAFGTGDHPTTAACLCYLDRWVWRGCDVLDVGTGSGVLAIAAALLGAASVTAIDIDPVACRSAVLNLSLNPSAAGRVTICCQDAAGLRAGARDIVVANLASDLLVDLAPRIRRCLAHGGLLIASGVSNERAAEVRSAMAGAGLRQAGQTIERGWTTMIFTEQTP
jgi:ribosomal protein L11 methyltransferase